MRNRSKSVYTQREAVSFDKKKSQVHSDTDDTEYEDDNDEEPLVVSVNDWSIEEKVELIRQCEEHMPRADTYYLRTLSKIDWSKFKVGNHSAEDIKEQLHWLIKPLRKTRNLREVISDANASALQKSHADMPKRPLSAYNIFVKEKYQKVKDQMPKVKPSVLMKKLSDLFNNLPPKKKLKYLDRAEAESVAYHEKLAKFNKEHPEFKNLKLEQRAKKRKTMRPLDVYIEELKTNKQFITNAMARKQWSLLPMASKVVYIKKLLLSNHETPSTELLNKKDMAVLDEFNGRPVKPRSAYTAFCCDIRPEYAGQPFGTIQKELAERWKNSPEEEKAAYKKAAKKAMTKYRKNMKEYISKLPEEERARFEKKAAAIKPTEEEEVKEEATDDDRKKKKKKSKMTNGSAGSEEEVQTESKSKKAKKQVAVVEEPTQASNVGVFSFGEADDERIVKKKKKKGTKEPVVEEPEEQPPSVNEEKKKKKKRHKETQPLAEPDSPIKKRKKDKRTEEDVEVPQKSPKKHKAVDDYSEASTSPKKKKKKLKLQRPAKNAFTYFVLNYCDQDHGVAVAEWKNMSHSQKRTVRDEWDVEKKKFIQDLQNHIVASKKDGFDFSEGDIVPCPVRYDEPDSE